jgi:hypothetical protein
VALNSALRTGIGPGFPFLGPKVVFLHKSLIAFSGILSRDPEFSKSADSPAEHGYQTDLPLAAMEFFMGLNRMEIFADLVSDYAGFQTTVLRYGLLDGQSGSFFSSFRPHVRATLRLTA